jgi:hypothetical protein
MDNHWEKLTHFLEVPGAALDNKLCVIFGLAPQPNQRDHMRTATAFLMNPTCLHSWKGAPKAKDTYQI